MKKFLFITKKILILLILSTPHILIAQTLIPACSGTPSPGNTLSNVNPVCYDESATLSLQYNPGESGLIYQWQVSNDGVNFSFIPGANSAVYTTPSLNLTTYYNCLITCVNSALSATSNVIAISVSTPIVITDSIVPDTIQGGSNGAIYLSISGGNPPYSFLWANGAVTQHINGLTPGYYPVTVSDLNGCSSYSNIMLNDYTPVSDTNFYQIRNTFYNGFDFADTIEDEDDSLENSGLNIFRKYEETWQTRLYPSGSFNFAADKIADYVSQYNSSANLTSNSCCLPSGTWVNAGPNKRPQGTNGFNFACGTGRLQSIAFDKNFANNNIMYTGSPYGGLWKSTDQGSNWTNANTDQLPLIGVSDVVTDPNSSQNIFIATGDADGELSMSIGIYRSMNGGATWNRIGITPPLTGSLMLSGAYQISKLLIDPDNSNVLYAATSQGIFKTSNALGATPLWSKIYGKVFGFNLIKPIRNIQFRPFSKTLIASGRDILVSKNNGLSWLSLTGTPSGLNLVKSDPNYSFPQSEFIYRINIAVTPSNPDAIYARIITGAIAPPGSFDTEKFQHLFKYSFNSGMWIPFNAPGGYDDSHEGQLAIAVSPNDPDLIYLGSKQISKSIDGGVTWNDILDYGNSHSHPDIHEIKFSPDGSFVYAATDGGLFKIASSSNNPSDWIDCNNGLEIGTIYDLAVAATNSDIKQMGEQDCGSNSIVSASQPWKNINGGDGAFQIIDWSDANIRYVSAQGYGGFSRTINGWISRSYLPSNPSGNNQGHPFIPMYIMDPVDHDLLYMSYQNLYKLNASTKQFTQLSNNIACYGLQPFDQIYRIAVAPSNPNYIYISTVWSNKLLRTTIGGGTGCNDWTSITPPGNPPISYIEVDPLDPLNVWITISGYDSGNKVKHSINGGLTWTDYSAGLPNLPVNCIVSQKYSSCQSLFVGTDNGVYYRNSTMSSWIPFDQGLPNVRVNDLVITYQNSVASKIHAGTWGRGVWESDLLATAPSAHLSVTNVPCGGGCLGSIIASGSGGTPSTSPQTYSATIISGPNSPCPGQSSSYYPDNAFDLFSFLGVGTYTVKITDGAGCTNTANAIITEDCDTCNENSLIINTGYNHRTSSKYNVGEKDDFWTVIQDPPLFPVSTINPINPTLPRPADIINVNSAWANSQQPFSQWIGPDPASSSISKSLGYTYYEYYFCLKPGFTNPTLFFSLFADNTADIYLNGTPIMPTTSYSPPPYKLPLHTATITNQFGNIWIVGRNTLRVAIYNSNKYTGFNLTGEIHTDGPSIGRRNCCVNGGGTSPVFPPVFLPKLNTSGTNVSCPGLSNGAITFIVSGGSTGTVVSSAGWGPVNYNLHNLDTTILITGLPIANYSIFVTDSLGNTVKDSVIIANPSPVIAGPISGPATQCVSYSAGTATFSIPSVAGAVGYTWSVPSGLTITTGQGTTSITVSWTAASIYNGISGTLCANVNTTCGIIQGCVPINLQRFVPGQPGTITGAVKACPGEIINYSINPVARATSYTWTTPIGSTIVSGQGSSSITLNFSTSFTATGTLNVTANNDCGSGAVRTLSVSRNTPITPSVINGAAVACAGTTGVYSVTNVSGINYIWTAPSNSSIISGQGTNSITINFSGLFASGSITVKASNGCGISSVRTLSILSKPLSPGTISGTAAVVCAGTSGTYSVPNSTGATSYNWTVPANASITSGQGTPSILVNFSALFVSGTINVAAINSCGSSPLRSLAISSLPSIPGIITGPDFNNCTTTSIFSIAAVPNASSYLWSTNVPGAVVNSSGISAGITFPAFSSGSVTVRAINSCGTSASRSLAVKGTVATPALINGNTIVTPCNNESYSITPLAGATSYLWTLPTGSNIISGQGTQSITVHFGSVSGNISVRGVNACGNGTAKSQAVSIVSCTRNLTAISDDDNFENDFIIEPNPFSTFTTIHLNHKLILRNAEFVMYDLLGNEIKHISSINDYESIIEKENMASGIYFLRFINNNEKRQVTKLIIQ